MTATVIALRPIEPTPAPNDPLEAAYKLLAEVYEPMLGIGVAPIIEAVDRVAEYVDLLETQAHEIERERRDLIDELGRTEDLLLEAGL